MNGTEDQHVTSANAWIIALSVMFSTFMEVLDTTVVNVSLPHIAGNLSATVDEATWVLTSYLVANAIILPLTGWLANYFGRKRLLMSAVVGFTCASFLCGLAPNLPALVIFRILQGATGAVLQPMSQAIMLEAFAPEDRGKAMGFWALGIVVAPMLGPVLGGWLTDSYTWRWVFYINIPIGAISLVMIHRYVFDPHYIGRTSQKIDWTGISLLVIGIGALQVVLDKGQQEDWFTSNFIRTLAAFSFAGIAGFIYHELTTREPVINLRVFKLRTYSTGVFLMTVLGFVLYGSLVILPILLQTLLGYSALKAGIATAPRGLGSFLAMPLIGYLTTKTDPRKMLTFGLLGGGVSLIQLSLINLNVGYWDLFWPQFLQGVSLGLLFVPLTTISMDPISKEGMGNATSLFNLLRNTGGSVGIAAVTTMLSRRQQMHTKLMASHIDPYNFQTQQLLSQLKAAFMAKGADAYTATQRAYAAIFGIVQKQAAMISFVEIFRLMGFIFLAAIPLIFLMKRPRHSRPVAAH